MTQQIPEQRQRRLELARQAFKEFYAQCFWSSDPNHVVEEAACLGSFAILANSKKLCSLIRQPFDARKKL